MRMYRRRGLAAGMQAVCLLKCAAAHLPREKGGPELQALLFLLFGARDHLCRFELVWGKPGFVDEIEM